MPVAESPQLAASTRQRYRRYRLLTFALTWGAYVGYYLARKNFSVVKERLAQLRGLKASQLGDIDTGYLTAYAVGQFISGTLGDRLGGKRLIVIGLGATALINIAFGLAATPAALLLLWSLNGLAQSTGWPGCAKTFSRWYARQERGTVMGLWCTNYQFGPLLSTLVATWLLTHRGWSWAFFGPALILLAYLLIFALLQPRAPARSGLPPIETYYAAVTGKSEPADAAPEPPDGGFWENVLPVLRSGPIWTLGLTYVVLKFIRYTFLFWLPFFMSTQLNYDASEAGYSSIVFDAAGIAGAIFAGLASDRFFGSRRAPIMVLMMLLLALATYLYGPLSTMGRTPNLIGIGLIGFLLYGPDTIASGAAAVDFGRKRSAALAAGFVNGLGSIGAALSGTVVGRLSEAYGWQAVFSLFAPMCLVGAMLLLPLWNRTPEGAPRKS